MRAYVFRLFAMVVAVILIFSGSLILSLQPSKPLKDDAQEILDEEAPLTPNARLPRGTRSGTNWPMHRYDLSHSGFSTSSVPDNESILWSNTTGNGDGYGSPVVADGRVFIGSRDGYLYCFDLNTGERLWRTFLSSGDYSLCSTPAVANDHVVIFSAGDDNVYRLRVFDGSINWTFNPPGSGAYGGSSPAINNGRIYIGSGNKNIYCLNETTGSVIWTFTTGDCPVSFRDYGVQSSPAVANGRVFIGACDAYLYCFNESQPGPIADYYWRTYLFDAIFGSPAVANGRVYCGSGYYVYSEGTNSHTMFCLDEFTGNVIWSYVTGSDILSSPAIAYGNCYFTSTDGLLYCVDALSAGPTPTLHWSNTTGDTWSSPAVSDGKVVVGSRGTNTIYCYNATTGILVWSHNYGSDVYSSPAIADGKVVASARGSPEVVVCFGSEVPPPSPPAAPTDLSVELISGGKDMILSWNASVDDGGGEKDVAGYTVYKSSTGVNGSYEFEAWIVANGSLSYNWTDVGAGDGDLNDYFYIVRANDTSGNEEHNIEKLGKFVSFLEEGWNLISVPLIQTDSSIGYVLQTIEGNFTGIYVYHESISRPWLHWHKDKPQYLNDVIEIDNKKGYYINMLRPDYLVVVGVVPANMQIPLKVGWNLVGYPSLIDKTRDDALSSISLKYSTVYFYNTTFGREQALGPTDLVHPGHGYWIHAIEDCILIV